MAEQLANQEILQSEATENEQITQRKAKLESIRTEKGVAFPNDFRRDSLAHDLHKSYDQHEHDWFLTNNISAKVAGRIMTRRIMGKASFATIKDMSGSMQIYLKSDEMPKEIYEQFKNFDLGDIVGVAGQLFKTKTGELSIKANEIRLLSKSLRPLPEKFHGLADHEVRSRQRYLDLMVNDSARKIFITRSNIVKELRNFFDGHGFLEVETPMMQAIPGGALARPFITHHNALDMTLYLRIAPELYLKRLVVGGFEKVYEINRNFRNEGLSTRHNPEFTMIEFYQAYADYRDLMTFSEGLLKYLAEKVMGTTKITYQGQEYDFAKPFRKFTLAEAVLNFNHELSVNDLNDLVKLSAYAQKIGIKLEHGYGLGKIQYEIFEKTVEKELFEPTFITAYPAEVSPLARKNDLNPFLVDRFELFIGGRELANGFSELNDPIDQGDRFRKQVENAASGDEEAMRYDADYVTALEYGLPPTAGEGIGIDRLVMLFTDVDSIRDVILFPLLKSQE